MEDVPEKLCHECAANAPQGWGSSSLLSQRQGDRVSSINRKPTSTKKYEDVRGHDLGNMIDAILEEHKRTLQDVINNMTPGRSSLT